MEPDVVEISSRWRAGTAFEAAGKNGISVDMGSAAGEPANTPMELVLMALAGCTGADVVSIMEKKKQPVSRLEIRVRGKRAPDFPRIYTDIDVEFILSGKQLTAEAAARAIELSETKYCSVGAMLRQAAHIHSSFKIVPLEENP